MNHDAVTPGFEADKEEGNDGQRELKSLHAKFARTLFPLSPLGRGTRAEVAHPSDYSEVDDCAGCGENEHGDANGILMEPAEWSVENGAGEGKCGEADGKADAADCENGRTDALKRCHGEACA